MAIVSRELWVMLGLDPDDPSAIEKKAGELDKLNRTPVTVFQPYGDRPGTVH